MYWMVSIRFVGKNHQTLPFHCQTVSVWYSRKRSQISTKLSILEAIRIFEWEKIEFYYRWCKWGSKLENISASVRHINRKDLFPKQELLFKKKTKSSSSAGLVKKLLVNFYFHRRRCVVNSQAQSRSFFFNAKTGIVIGILNDPTHFWEIQELEGGNTLRDKSKCAANLGLILLAGKAIMIIERTTYIFQVDLTDHQSPYGNRKSRWSPNWVSARSSKISPQLLAFTNAIKDTELFLKSA